MDIKTKKEDILRILDNYINAEFLHQENMDKNKLLGNEEDYEYAYLTPKYWDKNATTLYSLFDRLNEKYEENGFFCIQFTFGNIKRDMFMHYFRKKFGWEGMPEVDFSEKDYLAFFSFNCICPLYKKTEKNNDKVRVIFIKAGELSTLCIAEDYLRKKGKISGLNRNLYYNYLQKWKNIGEWANVLPWEKPQPRFQIRKVFDEYYNAYKEWFYDFIREFKRTLSGDYSEEELNEFEEEMLRVYYSVSDEVIKDTVFPEATGLGLGSFYINDLEMIKNAVEKERFGKTAYEKSILRFIYAGEDEEYSRGRLNISSGASDKERLKNLFNNCLRISESPFGKWPGGNNPNLMQQLSVNLFRNNKYNNTGIFTVNGPPGTGKTTLLKEVIADILTRKALRLVRISEENAYCPDNIFENFIYKDETYYYLKRKYRDIYDYGILITSGTNNAVENITKEFPEKLKESELYNQMMSEVDGESFNKFPIMAVLGKAENRDSYYGDKRVGVYYVKEMRKTKKKTIAEQKKEIEKELEEISHMAQEFLKTECEAFKDRYKRILDLQKKLQKSQCTEIKELWKDYNAGGENYVRAQKYNNISVKEYNDLREELFVRSWRVHQFFAWSSAVLRRVFTDSVANSVPFKKFGSKEIEYLKLRYNSQFFVSPVVSSTFASISKTYDSLFISSSLGVIIVDEAGQITPQDALGALYRAKKALIVGDPKQIPPVVVGEQKFALALTCPEQLRGNLSWMIGEDCEVETPEEEGITRKEAEDSISSLQSMADKVNLYGSLIDGTWVGCPLILHFRCNSPMFDISNALSYGNTMINLSREPAPEKKKEFILEDSCWLQVRGKEGGGKKNHFVRRQAEVVLKMLLEKCHKLEAAGKLEKGLNLFVITPFVSIKEGFKNYVHFYISDKNKERPDEKTVAALSKWLGEGESKEENIGTVHTFQGKETDEVILFLGCDVTSSGAARWIFKNIVNVAVSRAKFRFYFVGNMEIWRIHRGREKDTETEESPVNTARRILNACSGKEAKMGLTELNAILKNTAKLRTRKEKTEYVCPVCGAAVQRRIIKGMSQWFCRAGCAMQFYLHDYSDNYYLDSVSIRKLQEKQTICFNPYIREKRTFIVYPEIVSSKDPTSGKIFKTYKFKENPQAGWKVEKKIIIPKGPNIIYNNSPLIQKLRKGETEADGTDKEMHTDYFDFMILDVIYTIKESGKNKFTAHEILKYLSGKIKTGNESEKKGRRELNRKSGVLDEIEERIKKMMGFGLYSSPKYNKGQTLLPNVECVKKYFYVIKNDVKESLIFEYLDKEESEKDSKILHKPILLLPAEFLDPADEKTGKSLFPVSIKWLMIKYYILQKIVYMYKVRLTNRTINFERMENALRLVKLDERKDASDYRWVEKDRFYKNIEEYMKYLVRKEYVRDFEINKTDGNTGGGYCGIQGIVINPG